MASRALRESFTNNNVFYSTLQKHLPNFKKETWPKFVEKSI